MPGSVSESYVAALQHDLADVSDEATRVGVVRRPTPWFHGVVDENVPALGPPTPLLEETKNRQAELEADGVPSADAHNRAMDAVDFEARYEAYLADDPDALAAFDALRERVAGGESVVLVCFENTDEKRCHRTALADRLRGRSTRNGGLAGWMWPVSRGPSRRGPRAVRRRSRSPS
jgi:uncharacterized protein YeaO (DUF488 family)